MICIVQSLLICACNEDNSMLTNPTSLDIQEENLMDCSIVTTQDAANVALSKLKHNTIKGRSANYTISTIEDQNGNPALYIVNFENNGGFVVVSAKREINPVLAWNTTGQYTSTEDNGVKIWQNYAVRAIQNADKQEDSIKQVNRRIWASITNEKESYAITPLSENSSEEWSNAQAILREFLLECKNDGIESYPLKYWDPKLQHYGPEKTYHKFNWEDCAYVTERDSITEYSNEFIKTKWGQYGRYNYFCPEIDGQKAPAGCVPIACAQMMFYFRFPSKYQWDDMEPYKGTDATAHLIRDLGIGMKADYDLEGTGVMINDCINYLKSLGYNCHEERELDESVCNDMESSVLAKKPLILCIKNTKRHCIVVGGVNVCKHFLIDDIRTFTTATDYRIVASEIVNSNKSVYFYLNWGWDGSNDGFYLLNNIASIESGITISWEAFDVIFVEPNC